MKPGRKGNEELRAGRASTQTRQGRRQGGQEKMKHVQGPKAVGVLAGEGSKVGLVASVLGVLMMVMLAVIGYPHALLPGLLCCLPGKLRPGDLVAHRSGVPVVRVVGLVEGLERSESVGAVMMRNTMVRSQRSNVQQQKAVKTIKLPQFVVSFIFELHRGHSPSAFSSLFPISCFPFRVFYNYNA